MSKSQILTKAHKMAKGAIRNGKFNGVYKNALSWAMKKLYAEKREEDKKQLEGYKIGNISVNLSSFCKTQTFVCATVEQLKQAAKAITTTVHFNGETEINGVYAELITVEANGVSKTYFWNSAIKRTITLNEKEKQQALATAQKLAA